MDCGLQIADCGLARYGEPNRKSQIQNLKCLFCVICGLYCLACAGEAPLPGLEDVPPVVAEVNGVPISRQDLVRELVGSAAGDALDRLARRALVEQAAKKLNITASTEDIEQQLVIDKRDLNEELIRDFPDVNKEFPLADLIFARYRMTLEEYKNLVVRQRLLTRRCLAKDIAPSEEELRKAFLENPELFQPRVQYHASHILITPLDLRDMYRGLRFQKPMSQMMKLEAERKRLLNPYRDHGIDLEGRAVERDPAWRRFAQEHPEVQLGAPPVEDFGPVWQKCRQLAEKVLAEIRGGLISWDQAVRKYSKDPPDQIRLWDDGRKESLRDRLHRPPGDLGTFDVRGPLVREFYEGVKNLKPGEIGGPVRTEYGFHLVKMLEVTAPPAVTFEQCRAKVEKLYIEYKSLARAEEWLQSLLEQASLKLERISLWPPRADAQPPAQKVEVVAADSDPVAGSINGMPFRRSEIWRELLRSDADEALSRLIHFEIVMTMLKTMGLERLEWESSDPARRAQQPPPSKPLSIDPEAVEIELNNDRLRKDREAPEMSFQDYIYQRYGQSVEEYKRKLEAGLILSEAFRRRLNVDDGTLRVQFALARDFYSEPLWYELSHILIKPTGGMGKADENARLQAKLMADQVCRSCMANPGSFAQLVRDFSMDLPANKANGGFLGACYPEVRSSDFLEAPRIYAELRKQKLQRGQFSAPIATARGWHIVRIDAVHPETRAEFEQVKARVERDFLLERARMYTDIWLRSLTAQAKVKRFLFQRNFAVIEDLPPDNFQPPKEK